MASNAHTCTQATTDCDGRLNYSISLLFRWLLDLCFWACVLGIWTLVNRILLDISTQFCWMGKKVATNPKISERFFFHFIFIFFAASLYTNGYLGNDPNGERKIWKAGGEIMKWRNAQVRMENAIFLFSLFFFSFFFFPLTLSLYSHNWNACTWL